MLLLSLTLAGCTSSGPVTGRITSVDDFDRDPCAVLGGQALQTVLVPAFTALAGSAPTVAQPRQLAENDRYGCRYQVTPKDNGTITALTLEIARPKQQSSTELTHCQQGSKSKPEVYQAVPIGNEGCLSPDGRLQLQLGRYYYRVTVAVAPAAPAGQQELLDNVVLAFADSMDDHLPVGEG